MGLLRSREDASVAGPAERDDVCKNVEFERSEIRDQREVGKSEEVSFGTCFKYRQHAHIVIPADNAQGIHRAHFVHVQGSTPHTPTLK